MKANINDVERIIRLVLGVFLLSLIFWGPKTLWGLIGIIPILTATVSFCPIYALLKIDTNKHKKD